MIRAGSSTLHPQGCSVRSTFRGGGRPRDARSTTRATPRRCTCTSPAAAAWPRSQSASTLRWGHTDGKPGVGCQTRLSVQRAARVARGCARTCRAGTRGGALVARREWLAVPCRRARSAERRTRRHATLAGACGCPCCRCSCCPSCSCARQQVRTDDFSYSIPGLYYLQNYERPQCLTTIPKLSVPGFSVTIIN